MERSARPDRTQRSGTDRMNGTLRHRMQTLPSGSVVHVWLPEGHPRGLLQLQHGFAEYSERYIDEYRHLIPQLIARGYEVWALDLPGHGRSPGQRAVTDVGQAVDDHLQTRSLAQKRNLPIALFGHSLGGLVTAASVSVDPRQVSGVILTAPVLLQKTPLPLRLIARGLGGVAPARNLPGKPAVLARDSSIALRAAKDSSMYHGTTTLSVASSALEIADRLWRSTSTWSVPLTIFHGTRDEATSHLRSAAFIEAIHRPDATLRTIDGGFHELIHDIPNDLTIVREVIEAIDAALEARPPEAPTSGKP